MDGYLYWLNRVNSYLYAMKKICLLLLVSMFFCISCQKPEIVQTTLNYDTNYFPLHAGSWKIYSVQAITIDDAAGVYDTANYYLKELHAGWVLNASNDSIIRLERYFSNNLNEDWKILSVWQAGIFGDEAFTVEDNIMYIKQKFPLNLHATWNGDAYNRLDTLQKYSYEVTAIHSPETIGTFTFDSVLTISQKFQASLVSKIDFEEKYSYTVGLVYKKQIDVYSSLTDYTNIPVEDKVTKGTMYYQELIAYGNE